MKNKLLRTLLAMLLALSLLFSFSDRSVSMIISTGSLIDVSRWMNSLFRPLELTIHLTSERLRT